VKTIQLNAHLVFSEVDFNLALATLQREFPEFDWKRGGFISETPNTELPVSMSEDIPDEAVQLCTAIMMLMAKIIYETARNARDNEKR
jgi:hypothetical protein